MKPLSFAQTARAVLAMALAVLLSTSAIVHAEQLRLTWDKKTEVAASGAHIGPWRGHRTDYRYIDDPTVAINADNVVALAWADQSRRDMFFQIYEADGRPRLKAPLNISRNPETFSWLPRMIITSEDPSHIYILWQEIIFSGGSHGGDILFARSLDGGKTFSGPLNLSNSLGGDGKGRLTRRSWHNGSLDLAMDRRGDLYAAWTEYDGDLWFSRSGDQGKSFTKPARIAGGAEARPARGPSLAAGADGVVYLAWTVGEDEAANIHLAISRDFGSSFGEPRTVFQRKGHADAPKLAVDGKGILHLVYAEGATGRRGPYGIFYTRSVDGARSFDTPRGIPGAHLNRFESAGFPSLGLDGEDNLYVVWELYPKRGHFPQGLGLSVSSDAGKSFAAGSIVPDSLDPALGHNGSRQGLLMRKLAVNEGAAIALVNSTIRRDRASRIWLYRAQAARR